MTAAKLIRHPAVLLAALYTAFVALLVHDAARLPERVATHFDWRGQPNGWMSSQGYLDFIAVFGLVFPVFPAAMCLLLRFLSDSVINIPHRDYWLATERRGETAGYLFRHALWLGSMMSGLTIVLHQMTVEANRQVPPQLSSAIWGYLVVFLIGIFLWVFALVRHFRLPKADSQQPVSA
jgi:ABC-type Fe3+ transport system permease subunit